MKRKKKILICSNSIWSLVNFRKNLAIFLSKSGYDIFGLAPNPSDSNEDKLFPFEVINFDINRGSINPIKELYCIIRLFFLIKEIKPDYLLTFTIKPNIYGGLICRYSNTKIIHNITGLGTSFLSTGSLNKFVIYLYKFSFYKSEVICFQNSDDHALFKKNNILKNNKYFILPGSGVNLDHFKSCRTKIEKNSSLTKFVLCGRILIDKGVNEFYKASKKLKNEGWNIECQLIGELDNKNNRSIKDKTLKFWEKENVIKYLGNYKDVRKIYNEADCIVLPSYREGTPRSLLEASSMSIPIIATDVPGCRHVIRDGVNGYLCKVKNYVDLAEKMKKFILLSFNEKQKMGENGRKIVEKLYNEKIVLNKYKNILSTLDQNEKR